MLPDCEYAFVTEKDSLELLYCEQLKHSFASRNLFNIIGFCQVLTFHTMTHARIKIKFDYAVRDHPFSTYAKFSEKLTFLPP